ncbi:MAG: M24 family metallopeptidase [Bdellovibrionota bacterium]
MEVQRKLKFIRELLAAKKINAVHLRGVDWFSWATGGGTSVVIMTNEIGVAEVLVTETEAWVLTNNIENSRLVKEELTEDFRVTSFPWQDTNAIENFVSEKIGQGLIASDRPRGKEPSLPKELLIYKMKMQPEEITRYRQMGKNAAEAMTEAMSLAKPDWTENQLAGAGAKALWSRGLEPTLILVAGESRKEIFRHPISKDAQLGSGAMMVFCARQYGLYANFTRFVYFRDLNETEQKRFDSLFVIESAAFKATKAGHTLNHVYSALAFGYAAQGLTEEIDKHHQGGPTGYLSRELVAKPLGEKFPGNKQTDLASDLKMESGMAFAWNPSLPGAKIEDTVLLSETGLEVLTVDPKWPVKEVNGLKRPNVWIRK